jgi:hypothetical protein
VAGSGSDLSQELVVGVEPAALDVRAAPDCPPGSVADVPSSRIICRQTWSASRRLSPLSQDVVEGDSSSASHDVPVLGAVKIVPRVGAAS